MDPRTPMDPPLGGPPLEGCKPPQKYDGKERISPTKWIEVYRLSKDGNLHHTYIFRTFEKDPRNQAKHVTEMSTKSTKNEPSTPTSVSVTGGPPSSTSSSRSLKVSTITLSTGVSISSTDPTTQTTDVTTSSTRPTTRSVGVPTSSTHPINRNRMLCYKKKWVKTSRIFIS